MKLILILFVILLSGCESICWMKYGDGGCGYPGRNEPCPWYCSDGNKGVNHMTTDRAPMALDESGKLYKYIMKIDPNYVPIIPGCKIVSSLGNKNLELWCIKKEGK